jgi:hypothetical protein
MRIILNKVFHRLLLMRIILNRGFPQVFHRPIENCSQQGSRPIRIPDISFPNLLPPNDQNPLYVTNLNISLSLQLRIILNKKA